MSKRLKKFIVVLNTDRGYFDYPFRAKDHIEAKKIAITEFNESGFSDEEYANPSSAAVIVGWPELWIGD